MVGKSKVQFPLRRLAGRFCPALRACGLLLLLILCVPARAALQFDVFLGFDDIVPEASWFPLVCELKNDGPSFTGIVEVRRQQDESQTRRVIVELPTGTLKQLVIPVFCVSAGYGSEWEARLFDERGRKRAEQLNLRPRKQIPQGTPLLGALARTASGAPVIRPVLATGLQPVTARLLPAIFPDNPLVLEGMDCLYLNSERASDLRVTQVQALLAWLRAGGHLIVGVEQPADITSSPWLKNLFPCELKELRTVSRHPELQDWLRSATWNASLVHRSRSGRSSPASDESAGATAGNPFSKLPNDFTFEAADLQVATGQLRDGTVEVAAGEMPLVVTAPRGRGRITALLFSPEREPVRSWKNLPTFWAKLADVPGAWYLSKDFGRQGGWSSDGIFGAMIDSRQVHKLPLGWLLLLLAVYLVVIGPLDQYWLKRLGKPMLTWITFPCYVVAFSLVIYFIGYKLRNGESEWNDLHVVDVLTSGGPRVELRGRTYSSVYSPSNQRYALNSQQRYAALRGEFASTWGMTQSGEKLTVAQQGDNFQAEIFVPVWTPQLYVSDWWDSASPPLNVTVVTARPGGLQWQVTMENRTEAKLTNLQFVISGRIVNLGVLGPRQTRTVDVSSEQGTSLGAFVQSHGSQFQNTLSSRRVAFGKTEKGLISDLPNSSVAASFLSQLNRREDMYTSFVAPPGLDLSRVVEQGRAVLLAWAEDYSPIKPMYQFSPRRSHRNTLWRVVVPVE